MAAEVLGQLLGRAVAPRGLLAQRLEDDRVQVAAQLGRAARPPLLGARGSVSQTARTIPSSESVCTL